MKFQPLLLVLVLFISATAISQHQKGDWMLDISASPYPTEQNNGKDFGIIGLTGLEFFVSDKVSISGNLVLSDNSTFKNESNIEATSYSIVPSVQYYFLNRSKLNVFGHVGYGLGFKSDTSTPLDNEALRIYSVGPGAHYRINETLWVKLFLPYFNAKDITFDQNEADGVAVFLGLQFKL